MATKKLAETMLLMTKVTQKSTDDVFWNNHELKDDPMRLEYIKNCKKESLLTSTSKVATLEKELKGKNKINEKGENSQQSVDFIVDEDEEEENDQIILLGEGSGQGSRRRIVLGGISGQETYLDVGTSEKSLMELMDLDELN